jgi:hypothetical protein
MNIENLMVDVLEDKTIGTTISKGVTEWKK